MPYILTEFSKIEDDTKIYSSLLYAVYLHINFSNTHPRKKFYNISTLETHPSNEDILAKKELKHTYGVN
jgi:hypothetical protein